MIEKNGKYDEKIIILGFKNVSIPNMNNFLKNINKETNNVIIQFFDAKKVAGFQHIYFAAYNALNSFKKKSNISKNLAIEVLLYASAQRQIKKAMEIFGIKRKTSEIVVLIILKNISEKEDCIEFISKKIPGERDDNVLLIDKNKLISIRRLFEISDIEFEAKLKKQGFEIEALIDLIIERMALLVT